MKKCSKCGKTKDESEFYTNSNICKECCREKAKERYKTKRQDPEFVEKERLRSIEKYNRLNYKEKYSTKGKSFTYDESEKERTCVTCGKTLPISHFYRHCGYYLRECKWCKSAGNKNRKDRIFKKIDGEIWKPLNINGTNIEVSNLGRISYESDRIKYLAHQHVNDKGYLVTKYGYVHRLVVMAFIGEIPPDKEINHIDGNKKNANVENLEIVTHQENMLHAKNVLGYGFDYYRGKKGKSHPKAKTVLCKDLNGNIVAEYESISLAAEATGNSSANISAVCHHKYGHNTCGGYVWELKK